MSTGAPAPEPATQKQLDVRRSANDRQPGGRHYMDRVIQPWDFIHANNIGFLAGNVIKYVARYEQKGGLLDLEKAEHYLQKLIEEQKKAIGNIKPETANRE
jgi:hypothetical protein